MLRVLRRLARRIGSLNRGDFAGGQTSTLENADAMAASPMAPGRNTPYGAGTPSAPVGWVPPVDEGRPRH